MVEPVASMTGSGTAVREGEVGRLEVELRSVNHRFLKTTVRAIGRLPALDARLEAALRGQVTRGHVSAFVRRVPPPEAAAAEALDGAAFAAAARRLTDLALTHGLPRPQVADVLSLLDPEGRGRSGLEGAAGGETGEDALTGLLDAALAEATGALLVSRRREGALLVAEIRSLLADVRRAGDELARRAGEIPLAARERLRRRLDDLLSETGFALDPAVLAREAAVLADRADVREEVARLEAHVTHAEEVLAEGGPVGRRLDFLVQEMHREASTIGSKAGDLEVARVVVDLKTAVERLREQVQNLE